MSHKFRGRALIFNNKYFEQQQLPTREGTDVDMESLSKVLRQMGFKVKEYTDLTRRAIIRKINKAGMKDHSECDCILIAILSHGKMGSLQATDTDYPLESILSPFTIERCPTLGGKPKIFIIQACQGDHKDPGHQLLEPGCIEADNNCFISYRIPLQPDFLIAFSTIPGFCSWRNTVEGSWFIQNLCEELSSSGKIRDILTQLTFVAQRVAFNYESFYPIDLALHQKKQIPCTMSMLTRILYFRDNETGHE
ncbi:caspase-like [Drosophila navojoa]|uniref:caspase-like n=1 Tax=Drosophila navojoa TaxID=7232 RepID=UPI0011BD749C|nr:caspase-like [Drosophila navojoa]